MADRFHDFVNNILNPEPNLFTVLDPIVRKYTGDLFYPGERLDRYREHVGAIGNDPDPFDEFMRVAIGQDIYKPKREFKNIPDEDRMRMMMLMEGIGDD